MTLPREETGGVTAATITDDQIAKLERWGLITVADALTARGLAVFDETEPKPVAEEIRAARARCAEAWNSAKVTCRACEGDGILIADASAPPNERVTRDSRRCNYCGGKGWVRP